MLLDQLFHASLDSLNHQWVELIFDVVICKLADQTDSHPDLVQHTHYILLLMVKHRLVTCLDCSLLGVELRVCWLSLRLQLVEIKFKAFLGVTHQQVERVLSF